MRFNPFDLDDQPDALTRRARFLHTLIGVLLGEPLDPAARAALDTAIVAAYRARGISADARTHRRPAPVLADLAAALRDDGDPAASRCHEPRSRSGTTAATVITRTASGGPGVPHVVRNPAIASKREIERMTSG